MSPFGGEDRNEVMFVRKRLRMGEQPEGLHGLGKKGWRG